MSMALSLHFYLYKVLHEEDTVTSALEEEHLLLVEAPAKYQHSHNNVFLTACISLYSLL
jgi:hypothetical protein